MDWIHIAFHRSFTAGIWGQGVWLSGQASHLEACGHHRWSGWWWGWWDTFPAKRFPNLKMVVDHIAKPLMSLGEAGLQGWRWPSCIMTKHLESPMQCMDIFWSDMIWGKSYLDYLFGSEDMAAAASFPNVFCKLSGLVTEVPFNCPQWWILILHFSHPHQVDPPPPHHPSTPSFTHIDTHPHPTLHQADPERQEKVWSAETFRSYTDLCLSLFGPDRFQMMSKEIWIQTWIERTHDVNEC